MKFPSVPIAIAAVAALLGFGLGWALKPAATSAAADREASAGPDDAPPPRLTDRAREDRERLIAPPVRRGGALGSGTGVTMEEYHRDAAARLARPDQQREDAKLRRLREALGLGEEQVEQLRALIDQARRSPDSNWSASVRAILDDEQELRFDEFLERAVDGHVESRALEEMGRLQGIDLTSSQREALLERFRDSSRDEMSGPEAWDPVFGQPPSFSGYREVIGDPSQDLDPNAVAEQLRQVHLERVAERVELVEDLLTPAQLAEYRARLGSIARTEHSYTPRHSIRDPRFRRGF